MITSENGRKKIEAFEGCVLHAYKARPSERYYTIGYGHYGADVDANMHITQAEADRLFQEDLKRFEKAVNDLGMLLNQQQFDALVDFAYNCGTGALQNACKVKDIEQIAKRLPEWCKDAGGHVLPGLQKRRAWEVDQLLSPVIYGIIKADVLNIREGAGTDNIIIGSYKEGTRVPVYEAWYRTDRGWISAKYVDVC
jgi:GH24 family phage-related lysozyme (muramidase)